MSVYEEKAGKLGEIINRSKGRDEVVIYIKDTKQMKQLPPSKNVHLDEFLKNALVAEFGEDNIKVTESGL